MEPSAATGLCETRFAGAKEAGLGRVLLVDDHPLFRRALRTVVQNVQPDLVIEEAETLEKARAVLARDADVLLILLDLNLPDCQGFNGLLNLESEFPQIPIAIVSSSSDPVTIRRAIAFGAAGFIPKSSNGPEIVDALRAILSGDVFAPVAESDQPVPAMVAMIAQLSPAQLRMLIGLRRGLRNKEIAYEMGVTESTVKAYMTTMFRKLGVTSRTQAILAAQTLLEPGMGDGSDC